MKTRLTGMKEPPNKNILYMWATNALDHYKYNGTKKSREEFDNAWARYKEAGGKRKKPRVY
jgi:hypothetical protein